METVTTVSVSLVSVIIGAGVAIFTSQLNFHNSKKLLLDKEQRKIVFTLSQRMGKVILSLRKLSNIRLLQMSDLLRDSMKESQSDISALSSYYFDNKVLLPNGLRAKFDKILEEVTQITVRAYLESQPDKNGRSKLDIDKKALEDFQDFIDKKLLMIQKLSDEAEQTMRNSLGVNGK